MATELGPGQMLGHYRIEGWLGAGAMGVVYRAVDTHLDRLVAVKVLRPESMAHPERRKRFVQEAKAASALNHPNIVTIYDIASVDGMDYIAMEYIDGTTLGGLIAARARRRGLNWVEAVGYGVQIADAAAAAHAAGLIHRDLKPANVMVNQQGRVKVLDFGLAKLIEPAGPGSVDDQMPTETVELREGPRTEDGVILGTVAYMSPEQAQGNTLDGRSDIFSLGAVLYEMLTGRPAFHRENRLATLAAILNREPQPLGEAVEGVPPDLERILTRCLRKDPARRFQNMADLKIALQELKEESDSDRVAPRPVDRVTRVGRTAVWMAGVALAAVVAVLASKWVDSRRPPAEKVLAVLPFCGAAEEAANRAFCEGLTQTVTSRLGQLEPFHRALRIVPAGDVRAEKITSPEGARRAFGVSLAVTGSIHRAAGEIRVTANLVNARTLVPLRSKSLRTRTADLAQIENQVVRVILAMLELELEPEAQGTQSAGSTASPGAYEYYVQGRGYLYNFDKSENIDSAITLFERALGLDPRYALAHAGLGEAYWWKYWRTKDTAWVEKARLACEEAGKLDATLAAAHLCLGTLYNGRGQHERALAEFQRVLEREPSSGDAHRGLAQAQEGLGKTQEAEQTYRRAIELRSHYWGGYFGLGVFLARQHRLPEAAEQFLQAAALAPDNSRAYGSLGGVYIYMGRYDEAIAALKRAIELRPTAQAYQNLGTIYIRLRQFQEAAGMLERARALAPRDCRVAGNLARAYYWTEGRRPRALEVYEQAIQLGEEQLRVNPRDTDTVFLLATYHAMLERRQQAHDYLGRGLRLESSPELLAVAALIHNQAGERKAALDYLEKAVAGGYSPAQLQVTPELDNLRDDPKFVALIRPK